MGLALCSDGKLETEREELDVNRLTRENLVCFDIQADLRPEEKKKS